ncbi:unnamed protein product [Parascedosporium putredinis]|uniref:DUF6603 domain-containing protein n=1 Tax=Parascedosporium putredinis TaxID=1442378 RepID=A0A9P1MB15_9PEZI|nr:unnamed protein product [Parascedosporium putredinis]CAI7995132.1 unnamed protein product [Parascedosporium putredinis]
MRYEQERWVLDGEENTTFTMFFVMFRIQGPLFSVGFADIAGLTGVLPEVGQGGGAAWFSAREGSFWFAAGFKATAFQMLSVDALVVVQLNPEVQLGIYGLGIACTLDVGAGTFKLEAQLSPRSFILDSSCHLTGGLALYAWFAPRVPSSDPEIKDMQGDWVSALRISGEAYFAVTPRVCMAGGKLNAALTLGALSAWFDAFLDMLLNFDPFYFRAVGGVSVGVRFSMDLWLVTIHIAVEIGATLTVAGPPMAGMVHVDFWVFGFDIQFGGKMAEKPDKKTLLQFKELVFKTKSSSSSALPNNIFMSRLEGGALRELDDDNEDAGGWVALENAGEDTVSRRAEEAEKTTKPFIFNCDSGLVPPTEIKGQKKPPPSAGREAKTRTAEPRAPEKDKKKKKIWVVQPGTFAYSITFAFATSKGTLEDKRPGAAMPKQPLRKFKPEHDSIFALPMRLEKTMTVDATVRITQQKKLRFSCGG